MALDDGGGSTRLSRSCSLVGDRERDTVVMRLYGEFDLASEKRFQEELGGLVADRTQRLMVDLRGLTFIDSTGLRMLISLNAIAGDEGFDFEVLCSANGAVRRALMETGLDGLLPVVDGTGVVPATDSPV